MAKYFNLFPKTLYTNSDDTNSLDTVTNIISRFSFEQALKDNSSAFYKYEIKETDTPEIIARKFYDHSERHWIVLMFNDIVDPQFDWPLEYRVLNDFINTKYSTPEYADTANTSNTGLAWSQTNVHSYYKVIRQTTSTGTTIEKFEVDSTTYANNVIMQNGTNVTRQLQDGSSVNIVISKETKSYYDYEVEENEKKRNIKLLKKEFIPAVEKEFKRVIR